VGILLIILLIIGGVILVVMSKKPQQAAATAAVAAVAQETKRTPSTHPNTWSALIAGDGSNATFTDLNGVKGVRLDQFVITNGVASLSTSNLNGSFQQWGPNGKLIWNFGAYNQSVIPVLTNRGQLVLYKSGGTVLTKVPDNESPQGTYVIKMESNNNIKIYLSDENGNQTTQQWVWNSGYS